MKYDDDGDVSFPSFLLLGWVYCCQCMYAAMAIVVVVEAVMG